MKYKILVGNVLEKLDEIPDETVRCCVTSPAYWRQRNYEVDGQFGLEETIDEFVEHLGVTFDKVKRVLSKTGVLFLNLGDCYNGAGGAGGDYGPNGRRAGQPKYPGRRVKGLAPKNLVGVPWRVAFELQRRGWVLRQEIIWDKGYGYESVDDRPTREHEQIFLFSQQGKYYYDSKAEEVPLHPSTIKRAKGGWDTSREGKSERYVTQGPHKRSLKQSNIEMAKKINSGEKTGKNIGTVWKIRPNGRNNDHLATFPIELPIRCIKLGTKPGDVVLDCFCGSGTTGEAALRLGRDFIGIDLNKKYAVSAELRCAKVSSLFVNNFNTRG